MLIASRMRVKSPAPRLAGSVGPAMMSACEAAWQGVRRSPTLRAFFQRVMRKDPDRKKIALVATAHHLLKVMAAMLRTGEMWRESVVESPKPDGGCAAGD